MELPTPVSGDGETSDGRVTRLPEQSYANVLKKTYPNIILEFECFRNNEEALSQSILVDFLFLDLKVLKTEIKGLVMFTKGNRTVMIKTKESVNVPERFANQFEFVRSYGEKSWRCVVRGAQKSSVLRILGVPCETSNEDLIAQVEQFAKTTSKVDAERFGERDDPRLRGWTNGNRRVMIVTDKEIPDFITVESKRFRVLHRDQIRRCYSCRKEGHFKAECPSRGLVDGSAKLDARTKDVLRHADPNVQSVGEKSQETVTLEETSRETSNQGINVESSIVSSPTEEGLVPEKEDISRTHVKGGSKEDVGSVKSDFDASKRKLIETDITPTHGKIPSKRNKAVNMEKASTPIQTRSRSASDCSKQHSL